MNKIEQKILQKNFKKYILEDGGNSININLLKSDGRALDKDLLEFLLLEFEDEFFMSINNIKVFDKEKFLDFISFKNFLSDSYTRFANKIALCDGRGEGIAQNTEVVLDFPFKDCVLEGGASKDSDKKKEIFFNQTLASDEIDRLFSPKVLDNFSYITEEKGNLCVQNDVSKIPAFIQSGDSSIAPPPLGFPNLLLKGNNLLSLHSLRYIPAIYGNVKLIYIDPPYNTGNDSFNYNDRFNHSTWLTFMKNRLEVAREFLRDDGVMFIQCDDNEQAYLKVLCDEIFGRENFVGCVVWLKGNAQNDAKTMQRNQEYILCYARDINQFPIYQIKNKEEIEVFKDEKTDKFYYEGAGLAMGGGDGGSLENRPNLGYTIYYNHTTKDIKPEIDYDKKMVKTIKTDEIYIDNQKLLNDGYIPIRPPKMGVGNGRWKWALEKFNSEKDRIIIKKTTSGYSVTRKEYVHSKVIEKNNRFYTTIEKSSPPKSFISIGSGKGTTEVKELFGDKVFTNPKSESLLKYVIEISTQPGDLVMDFFAGSGTTLAVAHKMGRRWVGIEQMDYIESITKERLCKVILGEQGGVSKAVGWNPLEQNLLEKDSLPNAFVYAELMPLNEAYKKLIIDANEQSISDVIARMQKNAFLDYRVDFARAVADGDFLSLSLDDKKKILLQCLDNNLSYVPFSEIKDSEFGISDDVIGANEALYKGRNQ